MVAAARQEVVPSVGVMCSTHRKRWHSCSQVHASPALPPHTSVQAEQNTVAECRRCAHMPARMMREEAAVATVVTRAGRQPA